ncbi:aldehyde dehydrogenase [Microbacterium sp. CPCC 204701]|uniref:aldehyde dehydrogenase n=1 Tax=Microbacterium sp. CPCC 204701 TaxID=2493084 RepID=UPI000FDC8C34|nr:aldehyde dehydrogenase [Microbacterium sp. CPCC 204701]
MNRYGHVIGGVEVDSVDGKRFPTVDPWTRQSWADVALGSAPDAERAVHAARTAFDEGPWPRMSSVERGQILHRIADLIEANGEELGLADTHDMGKPIAQSVGNDIPRSAMNFRFFADHARLATAESYPMGDGFHAYSRYEPAGVVAAIAPWNFPLMMATWKVAPALAWGNTVILKPSEHSPVSGTILGRLALEAGLPPGVLNVVQGFGPSSAGEALTADRRVDRVTFTGESATGRTIARAAGGNLAGVSLELGGKGANIVFDDADLDNAVDWSMRAIFTNTGQVCLAGSRLYVQSGIYPDFLARFVEKSEAMRFGDPKDPATQLGPLSSEAHFKKVSSYLDTVAEDGGKIVTGGRGAGWSVAPTVVTGAGPNARVMREEIFGPVVTLSEFQTEGEAVAFANDTPYGLNAMVFTTDLSRAHRVAALLKAGSVWVNCFFIRDLRAPFGGAGDSGIGREGGAFSREFFTEPKAVIVQL